MDNNENDDFVEKISNFYAELSANQEPLGNDFAKVLKDNLWDLYEGRDKK
jgi:hypothetical protein